ncbi:hypothetical protein FHS31_002288 [Sphingomonas vulcanisoli]|uniref:ATPase n=1 Tax=Sphingomonas vulcanisoli TaxID=1658060 RepID=A0ABX0TW98_9SPHN|nr:hypothetical protein [Sphingomonas vulcanisoli]NIJ08667.1 hypothetical protein [Sphingomonas vulcanisoli]
MEPEELEQGTVQDAAPEPMVAPESYAVEVYEAPRRNWTVPILLALLGLIALGWIIALTLSIADVAPAAGLPPLKIAAWVGLGSGPLALLAVFALLLRTGRFATNGYARAAAELRTESQRIVALLGALDSRIGQARSNLSDHALALAGVGEEAGARLGTASDLLALRSADLSRVAASLDDATAAARTDLGVLLADLPQAEERADRLSQSLRSVGASTLESSALLEEQLTRAAHAAQAADQGSAMAARRLAAELDRLEVSAGLVDRRIAEATGKLEGASNSALDGAADTLDQVRRAIEEQREALSSMAAQGRAIADQAGDSITRGLDLRLGELGRQLAAQGEQSRALLQQLEAAIGSVEARFAAFGDAGAEQTADLAEALAALSDHTDRLAQTLGQGNTQAETLVQRAGAFRSHIEASAGQLNEAIPQALARLRLHAEQGLRGIAEAEPRAEKLAADIDRANAGLSDAGASLARHDQAAQAIGNHVAALEAMLAQIDGHIAALAGESSGRLADALGAVRAAAAEAADQARAAIGDVIPQSADALAVAGASAMRSALAGVGREEIAQVGLVTAKAIEAARAGSEQLTRQLMTIAETTQAIEARLTEQQSALTAQDEGNFARQIGLLIEALNSTAIDVAKVLSNEPTDGDWAAYLKGDRGIFTRRAVKLLDASEAKAVAARYGEDGEFREQVNRYIHDFEAMLRRVLGVREGGAMGVALLSSDAGKLYVALAQAIERLRR